MNEKAGAHSAVTRAVLTGRLPRPARCESCRVKARFAPMQYHHWSYDRAHWLDVIPLCRMCHRRIHTGRLPCPRTGTAPTDVHLAERTAIREDYEERALFRAVHAEYRGKDKSVHRKDWPAMDAEIERGMIWQRAALEAGL